MFAGWKGVGVGAPSRKMKLIAELFELAMALTTAPVPKTTKVVPMRMMMMYKIILFLLMPCIVLAFCFALNIWRRTPKQAG